jgi:outer membrane immunogenic protein
MEEPVMRRTAIAAVAIAASFCASQAALAADMPAAVMKAAPAVVVSNWTGAYIGAYAGGRWTDAEWATTCLQPGFPGAVCPSIAAFADRFANGNPTNFDLSGFRAGGYIGYNWQTGPRWVVGVEGDFGWGENKASIAGIPGTESPTVVGAPGLDSATLEQTWEGSIRLRGGYLVGPNTLLFATGGVAFTHVEATAFCGTFFPVGWCGLAANIGRADTQSTDRVGWTLGTGIEIKWIRWLARLEYRYSNYGTWSTTFLQGPTSNLDALSADIRVDSHAVQMGLAYKFTGQ